MFWFSLRHKIYVAFVGMMMKLIPGARYQLFAGEQSSLQLTRQMARIGLNRVLVVTDRPLVELGIVERATQGLRDAGINYSVFDGVVPDLSAMSTRLPIS